jgi:hypothetical protein
MKTFAVVVSVVFSTLIGCSESFPKNYSVHETKVVKYATPIGPNVYEMNLLDGTRCAITWNGITCDWRTK